MKRIYWGIALVWSCFYWGLDPIMAMNDRGPMSDPQGTRAVVPPTITLQPVSQSVPLGLSANFFVGASSSSSASFQWQLNGRPILGATTGAYTITSVQTSDAGTYSVSVTNSGGTATSQPAVLTVLPAALPVPSETGSSNVSVFYGRDLALTPSLPGGSPPFTYQWYRNAQMIAGATSQTLSLSNFQASQAGDYCLSVTNTAGTVTGAVYHIQGSVLPSVFTWTDAQQLGSVVYFLFTSPARIERYDLARAQWLPSTPLPSFPSAMLAAPEGLYVAFSQSLTRYSLDLSSQSSLAATAAPITCLFANSNYVYAELNNLINSYAMVDRTTGMPVVVPDRNNPSIDSVTVIPALKEAFATSSVNFIVPITFASDGTLSFGAGLYNSPYLAFPKASRMIPFPDQTKLSDDNGNVFRTSDLTYAGSLGGRLDDLSFLADGTAVVLRGNLLTSFNATTLSEIGRYALPSDAERIFTSGSDVFAFTQPIVSGGTIGVTHLSAINFVEPSPNVPAPSPSTLATVPDALFADRNGIIYSYAKPFPYIFRWSPVSRTYLSPLPLRGSAAALSYSATLHRIYCGYADGLITKLELNGAGAEQSLCDTLGNPETLVATDESLLAGSTTSSPLIIIYDQNGRIVSEPYAAGLEGNTRLVWDSSLRTVFGLNSTLAVGLKVAVGGTAGTYLSSPISLNLESATRLSVAPDGSHLLLNSGIILDPTALQQVGALSNAIVDGTWLGSGIYTVRTSALGTELQAWSATTDQLSGSISIPGVPLRIFALPSAQLLVTTSVAGQLCYSLFDETLNALGTTQPPVIQTTSQSQSISQGGTASFTVSAFGIGLSYQWELNGIPIPGANETTYTVANAAFANSGTYQVMVSNANGSILSPGMTLLVINGRLVNLSARANVTGGAGNLVVGFVVAGPSPKSLLLRGVGPGLYAFGITSYLPFPMLTLTDSTGTFLGANSAWDYSSMALSDLFVQVGAFPLAANSRDNVLTPSLGAGAYTAQLSSITGVAGVALAEIYDADPTSSVSHLVNLSARANVGSSDGVLVAGFAIGGTGTDKVLIRGVGPALSAYGVSGALTQPLLSVFDVSGKVIASNAGWNGDPSLAAAFAQVGAFAFPNGSADTALILTLQPGSYTAQVRGANAGTGIGLVEVYEMR